MNGNTGIQYPVRSQLELPPGFRFHPTDEELVVHYLCRKSAAQSIPVPIIAEIDLYKFDPWQLPEMALYGEKEWYFFSPRDRKYPNGSRPNRAAGTGYWKATGADKPVGKPKTLGIKKALVFYAGKAPRGIKTNWIMHEYRLANVDRSAPAGKINTLRLDEWVLCRIYNKKGTLENGTPKGVVQAQAQAQAMVQIDRRSESVPSCCCTEQVQSEFTCDREVQSAPKWDDLHFQMNNNNYADLVPITNPFSSQMQQYNEQFSPFQPDMLFMHKSPFNFCL